MGIHKAHRAVVDEHAYSHGSFISQVAPESCRYNSCLNALDNRQEILTNPDAGVDANELL